MTAVGGMLLLAHGNSESSGLIPDSPAHWMGAVATVLSFINRKNVGSVQVRAHEE
jgi:NAD(P) transhydrogenase